MKNEDRKKRRHGLGPSGLLGWAKDVISTSKRKARKHKHQSASITPEQLVSLRVSSTHCCDGCGKKLDWFAVGTTRKPHLHHDHKTGKVHGFSAPWCNRSEGFIRRDLEEMKDSVGSQLEWFEYHFPELMLRIKENISKQVCS